MSVINKIDQMKAYHSGLRRTVRWKNKVGAWKFDKKFPLFVKSFSGAW